MCKALTDSQSLFDKRIGNIKLGKVMQLYSPNEGSLAEALKTCNQTKTKKALIAEER